jgi:hypothetical protein
LQGSLGLSKNGHVVQSWIKQQWKLVATIPDMQARKLFCGCQDLLSFNSLEGTVCKKKPQQEDMGAENKRRVKYNLRQDICISVQQSASHSKR